MVLSIQREFLALRLWLLFFEKSLPRLLTDSISWIIKGWDPGSWIYSSCPSEPGCNNLGTVPLNILSYWHLTTAFLEMIIFDFKDHPEIEMSDLSLYPIKDTCFITTIDFMIVFENKYLTCSTFI